MSDVASKQRQDGPLAKLGVALTLVATEEELQAERRIADRIEAAPIFDPKPGTLYGYGLQEELLLNLSRRVRRHRSTPAFSNPGRTESNGLPVPRGVTILGKCHRGHR